MPSAVCSIFICASNCRAAVIIAMQFYLSELGSWVTVVQGVIFVICVLAFRRGIVGELAAQRQQWKAVDGTLRGIWLEACTV